MVSQQFFCAVAGGLAQRGIDPADPTVDIGHEQRAGDGLQRVGDLAQPLQRLAQRLVQHGPVQQQHCSELVQVTEQAGVAVRRRREHECQLSEQCQRRGGEQIGRSQRALLAGAAPGQQRGRCRQQDQQRRLRFRAGCREAAAGRQHRRQHQRAQPSSRMASRGRQHGAEQAGHEHQRSRGRRCIQEAQQRRAEQTGCQPDNAGRPARTVGMPDDPERQRRRQRGGSTDVRLQRRQRTHVTRRQHRRTEQRQHRKRHAGACRRQRGARREGGGRRRHCVNGCRRRAPRAAAPGRRTVCGRSAARRWPAHAVRPIRSL